jgi:hypothetical protein
VLRYQHGLFLTLSGISSPDTLPMTLPVDDVFLVRRLSRAINAVSALPEDGAKRVSINGRHIESSMRRPFSAKIWNECYGRTWGITSSQTFFWFSMYRLITARGAPPTVETK